MLGGVGVSFGQELHESLTVIGDIGETRRVSSRGSFGLRRVRDCHFLVVSDPGR